nr:P0 protein [Barley virus G]
MRCAINFDGTLEFSDISRDLSVRLAEFISATITIAFCALQPEYDAEALFRSVLTVLPLMLRTSPYTRGITREAWSSFARHALRTGGRIRLPPEFNDNSDEPAALLRRFLQRVDARAYAHALKRHEENFFTSLRSFQLKLESFCRRTEDPDRYPQRRHIEVLSGIVREAHNNGESIYRHFPDADNIHLELLDLGRSLEFDFPYQAVHPSDLIPRLFVYMHNALGPFGLQDFWRVADLSDFFVIHSDVQYLQDSYIQKELASV